MEEKPGRDSGSSNVSRPSPGASSDELWESAFSDYLNNTLETIGGSDSLLAEVQRDRSVFENLLTEIERAAPEQYLQLEKKLAQIMIDFKRTVETSMEAYRLYIKREEGLKDAEKADLALVNLSARKASEQMTAFLRQRAELAGENPENIKPMQTYFSEETIGIINNTTEGIFKYQKHLVEEFGKLAQSAQRERFILEWPPRLLRLFVLLIVLAIGSDLISGLVLDFWLHLIIVALLWAAQEYWLTAAVTKWIDRRRRFNLVRFTISSYRTKMQSLCDMANWDHRIAARVRTAGATCETG